MPKQGELQFFRRSDGKFTVVAEQQSSKETFRVRAWRTGHRRVAETATSRERAIAAAERIWSAYEQALFDTSKAPTTLTALVDRCLERDDLRPKTRKSYEQALGRFLAHVGGDRHPRSVTRHDVKSWLEAMTCKPSSKRTYLRTLAACLNWAKGEDWVDLVATADFSVKVEEHMRPWLEWHQWEAFLAACPPGHRIRARFVLETGVRTGELIHAKWSWIKGSIGRPSIAIAPDATTGFVPKWGKVRSVPLSAAAQEALEAARAYWPEGDFIFAEGLLTSPNFARENRAACTKAKVQLVDFHGLRRSAGARWLELGFSIHEVAKLLGHRSVTTTEKWYAGVSDRHLAGRFDLVDGHGTGDRKNVVSFPAGRR